MVFGVLTEAGRDVIDIAIVIQIPTNNAVPPTRMDIQTNVGRYILQVALIVLENMDRPPFGCDQEIDPAIVVIVRPQCAGDQSQIPEISDVR